MRVRTRPIRCTQKAPVDGGKVEYLTSGRASNTLAKSTPSQYGTFRSIHVVLERQKRDPDLLLRLAEEDHNRKVGAQTQVRAEQEQIRNEIAALDRREFRAFHNLYGHR